MRPDYPTLLGLSESARAQFLEDFQNWKARMELKLSTQEFQMADFTALTEAAVRELAAWLDVTAAETTAAMGIRYTYL